ncbi:hypothetical protein LAG90_16360 [Marinilongibacter aquaticus]|uniref:hypothetical protein n=1 Tax=Marinilongibacter aquaticus TaxID=2975157 RepID=UPI0021BD6BFA|nr:hypothetical protein [Marinilongibacter aquaticus]UBM58378.1 hypothetical protein LAG90_16360 [Marinilongibacter aquaticus]
MNKLIYALSLALLLQNCGTAEKAKESLAEKLIEKGTGLKIDSDNISNVKDQETSVELDWDGPSSFADVSDLNTSITVTKDLMAIVIKNDTRALVINFNANGNSLSARPLQAETSNSPADDGSITSNVNITDFSEMANDMNTAVFSAMKGTATVEKLTTDELVLKLEGQYGHLMDLENPEAWIPLQGTIRCKYPLISRLGEGVDAI